MTPIELKRKKVELLHVSAAKADLDIFAFMKEWKK